MRITRGVRRLLGLGGALLIAMGAVTAQALPITFTTFTPTPISPTLPEIIWTNSGVVGTSALTTGPGAQSSGDGTVLPANQSESGLQVHTSFTVPFAAALGGTNNVGGSTTFYDCALSLTGLNDDGPATLVSLGGGFTQITQLLTGGTFAFYSTTDVNATGGPAVLLLSGTFSNALLTGVSGFTQGAALSATINYTGGLIYQAYLTAGGNPNPSGGMSWTLQMSSSMSVGANSRTGSFDSNTNGEFNVEPVPEPASLALLALAGGMLLRRRAA